MSSKLEIDPRHLAGPADLVSTVHEIGEAIHPVLATGQIEGGSAQGLGYAMLEDVVMRDGRMANASLTNYIIPTTLDSPAIDGRAAGEPVPARAVWCEGRRRNADRRAGASRDQRAAARGRRRAGDSRDARTRDDCVDHRINTEDTKDTKEEIGTVMTSVSLVSFVLNGRAPSNVSIR